MTPRLAEGRERKVGKNYAVRLRCPYRDEDSWVVLQNRTETLDEVLRTPWDFECSLHGVQREIPLEATEKGSTGSATGLGASLAGHVISSSSFAPDSYHRRGDGKRRPATIKRCPNPPSASAARTCDPRNRATTSASSAAIRSACCRSGWPRLGICCASSARTAAKFI